MDHDHDHDRPPSSKRRRIMAPPEGFHISSAPRRKAQGPTIASFTSAFDFDFGSKPRSSTTTSTKNPQDRPPSVDLPSSSDLQSNDTSSSKRPRLLIPPALVTPPHLNPSLDHLAKKQVTRMTAFQPPPPQATPTRPRYQLQPPPVPSMNKPSGLVKALVPPSVPFLPPTNQSPTTPMRTISTTRLALATDPSTTSAGAELLSLFLQDNPPPPSSPSRELTRGVQVSPEKADRGGRGPKFLRNGLAEHANHLLSRCQTSFSLWQKEISRTLLSSRRPTPDLCLHVVQIIHVAQAHSSPTPHAGLAICRLTHAKTDEHELEGDEFHVLFSFASPSSTNARVCTAEDFAVDREVYVWKPWYKVDVGTEERGRTLLCSRFLFIRPSSN